MRPEDPPPGPLLGSGRTADVYDVGGEVVLRRYRSPAAGWTAREAAVTDYVRAAGFPAPAIHWWDGRDIVMERLRGPTMLADLARRPWMLPRHARTLADLHRRLHELPAPPWLDRRVGDGDRLLHMDLHPDNVVVTRRGAVVIDWTSVSAGVAAADVAIAWLILATAPVPGSRWQRGVSAVGRGLFVRAFLRHFDAEEVAAQLPLVAHDDFLVERGLPPDERARMAELAARHARPPG